MSAINDSDLVGFCDVPSAVNDILQEGVFLYRHDRAAAGARFEAALAADPAALATYYCLYKIHTYNGRLDDALEAARAGLHEASRQAGLALDWSTWTREDVSSASAGPAHFALYTLKAMAFIHLKRQEIEDSRRCLDQLTRLGEIESVGGNVIAELAKAVA